MLKVIGFLTGFTGVILLSAVAIYNTPSLPEPSQISPKDAQTLVLMKHQYKSVNLLFDTYFKDGVITYLELGALQDAYTKAVLSEEPQQ